MSVRLSVTRLYVTACQGTRYRQILKVDGTHSRASGANIAISTTSTSGASGTSTTSLARGTSGSLKVDRENR